MKLSRPRRRVRVQNERSKYRFSKSEIYYSEVTGKSYSYMGKSMGVFEFLVVGGGSFRGHERDMDTLQLQLKYQR